MGKENWIDRLGGTKEAPSDLFDSPAAAVACSFANHLTRISNRLGSYWHAVADVIGDLRDLPVARRNPSLETTMERVEQKPPAVIPPQKEGLADRVVMFGSSEPH